MGLRRTLDRLKRKILRRIHVGEPLTIDGIRSRHAADFTRLTDMIRSSGTDSLAHFRNGYTSEGGLYLQQNPDEFASLILLLREHRPLKQYMEIGSASGGTCLILHREIGFERVLSVDDGQHVRAVEQDKNLGQIPNCIRYIGDSHAEGARRFLEQNVQGKLDIAFIDGDHSYEGVWQDIRLTLPFCRPGTLLVFHDTIACPGVEMAWIELARSGKVKLLGEFIGADQPLGIGVAKVQ